MYNRANRTRAPSAPIRQEAALTLSDTFRYRDPGVRVFSGTDALAHLHGEARRLGAERAFAVCSPTVARETSLLDDVGRTLGDMYAGAYTGARRESPIPSVVAGVEAAEKANADLIVAVGGGSAVVSARAITILLAEEGTVYDLCTKHTPGQAPVSPRLMKPKLPNILVLTTPTNGANRGGAAVLDSKRPHRLELFDPKVRPTTIVLDAAALLTAPLSLYLDTATTTFNGVVSALQSRNLNAFSHADLREAPRPVDRLYAQARGESPQDAEPRLKLASAALLANRASDAAGLGGGGVSTSLDRQIRYRYEGVGQGAGGAAFLCATMRRNREALLAGQARIAELLGVRDAGDVRRGRGRGRRRRRRRLPVVRRDAHPRQGLGRPGGGPALHRGGRRAGAVVLLGRAEGGRRGRPVRISARGLVRRPTGGPMRNFRLALAQINTTVGDLEGNARKAIEFIGRARDAGADLVAFPELTVTGYPPEDLVFKSQFVRENLERTQQMAAATSGITAVFGFVDDSGGLRNAAAIARDGRLDAVYHKAAAAQLRRVRRGALLRAGR